MKKHILIIGISSIIGQEIAKKFGQNGYKVWGTYNKSDISSFADFCKKNNIDFCSFKMDTRDKNEIKNVFSEVIKEAKFLNALVYNAGVSRGENLLCDTLDDDIEDIINVNLKGAIYVAKEAQLFFLKQKYGSIIFISSIYGSFGGSCESVYSASKAGLNGLVMALSQECGIFNVRVNAVAPGFIKTKMTENFSKEECEQIMLSTPLNRLGEGEDVANCVYFLASEDASFITGQIVDVSGGVLRF